jgi:hypothetical protein
MEVGFDDSGWSSGKAGFGTRDTPGARVNTHWDANDIYVRRKFTLKDGQLHEPRLWLHYDEEADVYINGAFAVKRRGFVPDYMVVPISNEARATLHPGENTIAIHCRHTTGGQYIDAGLVDVSAESR